LAQAENVNEDISEITKVLQKNNLTSFVSKLCEICEIEVSETDLQKSLVLTEDVCDNAIVFAVLNTLISHTAMFYFENRLVNGDLHVFADCSEEVILDPMTGRPFQPYINRAGN
jgi:hypothetical protein